jgi:hypothetical protein
MRFLAFLILAVSSVFPAFGQVIPGRYIVEFNSEPAAALLTQRSAAARLRPGNEPLAAARRAQIQAEHAAFEPTILALGGRVTHRFDTLINGLGVAMTPQAAAQIAQMPNVKGVYPVHKHHALLDHALGVHHITDVVNALTNGTADAGKGIKIGIIDTGIDISHPGFQGFTTPIPSGYPIVSAPGEMANTNNKVIVSRAYLSLIGGIDQVGHGTGVAMIAAGLTNDPTASGVPNVSPITGVAPGAWLGNYNVFGDDGSTDEATFIMALSDALNDGMNVVNYSVGGPNTDSNINNGPEARAINAAVAAGMLVVVAAGNEQELTDLSAGEFARYPGGTVNDPAVIPAAIAVGSNLNSRAFDLSPAVIVAGQVFFNIAVPTAESNVTDAFTGPLVDASTLDPTGLGCSAFPKNSLTGAVVVISRGTCNFQVKLDNAQAAGAIAGIIYDNVDEAGLVDMSISNTLPAMFSNRSDGLAIKALIKPDGSVTGTADFFGFYPYSQSSNQISLFSSAGPAPSGAIKPDLVATGDPVLTADTNFYQADFGPYPPYTLIDGSSGFGTSFAAPMVTGSIALLMSTRPGLTVQQYRSLVINSTVPLTQPDGSILTPQNVGAGRLDVLSASQSTLTATPTSVAFGASGPVIAASLAPRDATQSAAKTYTQSIVIANTGAASDTFTLAFNPINTDGTVPTADSTSFTLKPGDSKTVTVTLADGGLATGEYHGTITVTGTMGASTLRIPYWYGVPGADIKYIAAIYPDDPGQGSAGDQVAILVRYTDVTGLPIAGDVPTVTTTGVRTRVTAIMATPDIPGTFEIDATLGRADALGLNVFTVTAPNGVSRTFTYFIQ